MKRKWLPSFLPPVRPKTEGPGCLPACGEIASGLCLVSSSKASEVLKMRGKGCEAPFGRYRRVSQGAGGLSFMIEDHR